MFKATASNTSDLSPESQKIVNGSLMAGLLAFLTAGAFPFFSEQWLRLPAVFIRITVAGTAFD